MNWKNVKLVFLREVRDQLRDRRTLFMIAVLPMLLYPALGIGMGYTTMMLKDETQTVVLLGADELPEFCEDCPKSTADLPPLLSKDRFRRDYFREPATAEKLSVLTDRRVRLAGEDADRKSKKLVEAGRRIREKLEERNALKEDAPQYEALSREISELMSEAQLRVLVIVPDGFGQHVQTVAGSLAASSPHLSPVNHRGLNTRGFKTKSAAKSAGIIVLRNSADQKSLIAYSRTKEAVEGWEDALLKSGLKQAKLPEEFAKPVAAEYVEAAEKSQISASLWSKIFPALLVMMAVTGAFYPAVDVAAGEKERGTMETLLICPASRPEIVVGKFFTVMLFSMSTALLNLLSMGITAKYMFSLTGGGRLSHLGDISPPSIAAIFWVVVLLIPLAALFSAASLALATFARSSKEGQYYLTPLLMVTLGLTFFCLMPNVEMDPFNSVLPIVGPTLLLKELLAGGSAKTYVYILPVLVTSIGYSLLAIWWAVEQFSREDILFREAERFSLRLWLRHLLRDKESTPSFLEAGFCFVLIMLLQFGAMSFMRDAITGAAPENRSTVMVQVLMVQQLAIIATPAVFMALMLTSNARKTLRLNWPSLSSLGLGIGLALVLHPVTLELSAVLGEWFFPPLPQGVQQQIAVMSNPDQSLWFILLAFAVAPAICEELAFRGFILSGFSRSNRFWLAILLSSAAFGLMHMIPQQVFNAALLGLVLGLLAVRSNSLLPGILFHLTYNALSVLNGRLARETGSWIDGRPWNWFVSVSDGHVRYEWPLLIVCAIIAVVLLRKLVPRSIHDRPETDVRLAGPDALPNARAAAKP